MKYLKENLSNEYINKEFIDNRAATKIFFTKIENTIIYISSLIGTCQPKCLTGNGSVVFKGDQLFTIDTLGLEYCVKSEFNGKILISYVQTLTIVDYFYPLILIKVND